MSIQRDVCLLFADVSRSTQLYETLGDKEALKAVERCVDAMRRATALNKGRVIKTIGDEVMAIFDTAAQGMQAASDMQQRIADLPPPAPGISLSIRAGMHFGTALIDDGDAFGDTVNTAARMAGLAKAGQILTTADTVAALPDMLKSACREIDSLNVKGKAEAVRVCEVIWQDSTDLTVMSTRNPEVEAGSRLQLQLGTVTLLLDAKRPAATLGRDAASDFVIHDVRASRVHAKIELRRGKFVLTDISSNGTYVSFKGEPEISLKREEAILRGSGQIAFGHALQPGQAGEPGDVLVFSVQN